MRKPILLGVAVAMFLAGQPAHADDVTASLTALPCVQGGPSPADQTVANQLNAQLTGKVRNSMNAYRVSCARAVVNEVKRRGLHRRAAALAVATAIVEDNLDNRDGGDLDSVGLFQQRASWGSFAERTNPPVATGKFLDVMFGFFPNNSWVTANFNAVCQQVQRSGHPDRYGPQEADAWKVVDALWQTTVRNTTGSLGDADGDGKVDLIAREGNGDLWLYPNTGNADDPYNGDYRRHVGTGWNIFDKILAADVTADGRADIIARQGNGDLWLYPNTGNPDDPFHGDARYQVGIKWNELSALTAADVDGDGRADLVAKGGDGVLWLYPNTDDADPFSGDRRREIGVNWNTMDSIVAVQLDADGPADLIARDTDGGLWVYPNTGDINDPFHGNARYQVGIKWNEMSAILVGDATVDGRADIVAREGDGGLWMYPNTDDEDPFSGDRRYSIGFGWNAMEDMT